MVEFQRKSTKQLDERSEQIQQPTPIEQPDPFDLEARRRDPQEGLVKAKKLLLEIPVVGRPDDTAWFRVHPTIEFPTRAIDLGRKDYYLVKPELHADLDRSLKPVVLHIISARRDEIRLWVRREKGPEDNDNSWWASAQTIAEQGKER